MFYESEILLRTDLFDGIPEVRHGFSAKAGGVSTHPHTASLNLAMGREDSDDVVRRNIDIFAKAVSDGACGMDRVVCAPQIHSAIVRPVTAEHCGEGVVCPALSEGDGFVTDEERVLLLVRVADCTPILLCGIKADGHPVIAAVHAGWRGTAKGIAGEAVVAMNALGCETESIRAAIGPHIGPCCYEVGADLLETVTELRGKAFAQRHITPSPLRTGAFVCDMEGMNREILLDAGVKGAQIDGIRACTSCRSDVYYSHRKTAGKRGAMGAGIVIL